MNRHVKRFLGLNLAAAILLGGFMVVTIVYMTAPKAYAAGGAMPADQATAPSGGQMKLSEGATVAAFWSAALATSVSCVAAGVAVGMTGSAAIGAVAERPEIMGRTILFVVFGEGLAIYGLAIALIILMKV